MNFPCSLQIFFSLRIFFFRIQKLIYYILRLRVNQLVKNHALIEDRDLAHEIFIAKIKDHGYGPIAESIKQSIG